MSPTQPPPDWSDERLEAAFRGRFDTPPPRELPDRIHSALLGVRPASRFRPPAGFPRFALPGIAVAALLGILLVSYTPILTPPRSPGPTQAAGGGSGGSSPIPTPVVAEGGIPTSITIPGSSVPQPVLTAEEALLARSNGAVGQELVVGGWYRMTPVPCAQVPDASSELESCAVNFTWLMDSPEVLTVTNADGSGSVHPPVGPAINLVLAYTDWTPPPFADGAAPIVVTGHFDDARATGCPDGARRTRCRGLFVVDAPLWSRTGSIDLAAAPTSVRGLDVRSVADAIAIRDSGSSDQIAVAGWLSIPIGFFSCPMIPTTALVWLEGRCPNDMVWLLSTPEPRVTNDRNGTTIGPPTGLAIQPAFESPGGQSMGNGLPNIGWVVPEPAVFLGHFNDPRSGECTGYFEQTPAQIQAGCRARYVVDVVVWLNGSWRVETIDGVHTMPLLPGDSGYPGGS